MGWKGRSGGACPCAAVARVAFGIVGADLPFLPIAGVARTAAFVLFLAAYGPMLLGPRR